MSKDLDRLIKYTRKEEVTLFIGSGFSLKAGGPKVCDIVNAIIQEGGEDFARNISEESLQNVSQQFVDYCGGRNDLIKLLGKIFNFDFKDLSDHELLTRIPHFKKIFTTNYDTLIEETYLKTERSVITSNIGCAYDDKSVGIYKMHGDITTLNDPDSIVITSSDYDNYFTSRRFENICTELKSSFLKTHMVFIGYSLEDDNVLDIIKTIRSCIGSNQKQMFLIAPGLSNPKRQQLKKNNVAYIDGVAETYLNELMFSLKNNIVNDYKHKIVSDETYNLFCIKNGNLFTTVTHGLEENRIDEVYVKDGYERDEKFNFTISNEIKEQLFDVQKYNTAIQVSGTEIKIPAYKIDTDSLINFEKRVNGIRFKTKDDISAIWIAPSFERKEMKIKMPAIEFIEKIIVCRYKEDKLVHIDMDTPIYILKITVNEMDPLKFNIKINADFKNTYSNNSDAIKWIKFLIAMYSGYSFFLNGFKLKGDQFMKDAVEEYNYYKIYYETISWIENKHGIDFFVYNNFSNDNYQNALYLKSYYECSSCDSIKQSNATITFKVDISESKNPSKEELENNSFFMFATEQLGDIYLNGKTFFIPYKTVLFDDCVAKEIRHIKDSIYEVIMENIVLTYRVLCSDNPPELEGNIIHIGNKLIE